MGKTEEMEETEIIKVTMELEETEEREDTDAMKETDAMEETKEAEETEATEETIEMQETEAIKERFYDRKDNNLYPDHTHEGDWLTLKSRKRPCQWTTTLPDCVLSKQLVSLYWVWIHPAHPILEMPLFLEHYRTGMKKYCSSFLVNAVFIAACDVLDPYWEGIPGQATNVAELRQNLVAEAELQEAIADPDAKTTAQALAIMSMINTRSWENA